MKKPFSRRLISGAVAVTVLSAMLSGIVVTPAIAASTPSTSSVAAVAQPGGLGVKTQLTGVVGGLLAPVLEPALNALVDPLLSGLLSVPGAIVGPLLADLVGAGESASTPGVQKDNVESTLSTDPSFACASSTCYKRVGAGVKLPGVLNLGASVVQGSTQRVAVGTTGDRLVAKSQVSGLALGGILGLVDVIEAGVIQSTSQCSGTVSSVSPTGSASTASITLLGKSAGIPVIGVDVSNSGGTSALTVKVMGVPLAVGGNVAVKVNGLNVGVALNGNLLNANVEVGLSQLLAGLGLGAVGALVGNIADLKANVNIAVGSGVTSTATTTQSAGLSLQLGLNLDL
ncbi:MAG: hypothetical protein JWQ43_1635, partial [Glaciihabitans sp.]|nr:hypothetical protein [Glaciihabitans sp.]